MQLTPAVNDLSSLSRSTGAPNGKMRNRQPSTSSGLLSTSYEQEAHLFGPVGPVGPQLDFAASVAMNRSQLLRSSPTRSAAFVKVSFCSDVIRRRMDSSFRSILTFRLFAAMRSIVGPPYLHVKRLDSRVQCGYTGCTREIHHGRTAGTR